MKTERFQSGQLIVERIRNREGPPVVYIAFNGTTARPFTDKKELLKFIRCPKSIPTGQAIRDWIDSFEKQPAAPAPTLDKARLAKEGFGPETHDADDPTANTKMVT